MSSLSSSHRRSTIATVSFLTGFAHCHRNQPRSVQGPEVLLGLTQSLSVRALINCRRPRCSLINCRSSVPRAPTVHSPAATPGREVLLQLTARFDLSLTHCIRYWIILSRPSVPCSCAGVRAASVATSLDGPQSRRTHTRRKRALFAHERPFRRLRGEWWQPVHGSDAPACSRVSR